jgi:hypothetical protein
MTKEPKTHHPAVWLQGMLALPVFAALLGQISMPVPKHLARSQVETSRTSNRGLHLAGAGRLRSLTAFGAVPQFRNHGNPPQRVASASVLHLAQTASAQEALAVRGTLHLHGVPAAGSGD